MSTAPNIALVSGTLSSPSKTTVLGQAIAHAVQRTYGGEIITTEIAALLGDLGTSLTAGSSTSALKAHVASIENADILVAVSPVFKGSYSGLFKHLFDLIDPYALTSKPVIVGATGGSDRHSLVVDYELRPLFNYFNAHVSPVGVFATGDDFVDSEIITPGLLQRIDRAAATLSPHLTHLGGTAGATAEPSNASTSGRLTAER